MVNALAMRRLFGTAALLCCALGIGASMASNDDTVDTINIAGQLGLYSHKFEDGSSVEYCLLTPADQSDEAIMIELDGALHDCHHAAEGVFSVAPHTTSKRNKSGCDERYLPLCVDASFQLKSAVKTNSEKKHEDSSEGEAEGEGGVAGQKAMNKISGARTVLFLELYYLDKSPACTTSCITQNMWGATYSIDGMYNEASYGLLRFSQSASKDIKLSMGTKVSSYNYCASSGTSKIKTDALAKLATTQSSVSASSFNHLVMMTPSLCGVAVSQVGGNLIWINSNIPDALAHELGHNLGRRHASLDTANTDPATRTSFSTDVDYGDKSCVMGYSGIGLRSHSVPNRIRMGWIPTSAVAVPPASTCTSSEIQYTVAASKLAANNAYGRHAIQFPRARGGTYHVSYRSGSGYDVNAPSGWKGAVFLHYTTSPSSRTKFVKALTSGATYTDSLTSTSVRVVSMGTNSATVAVRCGKNLATCTMSFSSSKQSSLSGTFAPVAKIGGYNAWARSDRKVVIGYCAAKTMWVVGAHDGSSTANFVPCNNIIFKSAAQTYYKSPTDVEVWYSKSSSSWPQDTSATFTVTYCASSKHEEEQQLEVIPQEQPAASTNDTATSAASVVSVSVSEDAQAAPVVAALHSKTSEEVCLYFSSLCSKCQMAPTNICSYLTDLCADCHA